ncbi:hypothetical protein AKJ16_DCAP11696 [Drosera capensis]
MTTPTISIAALVAARLCRPWCIAFVFMGNVVFMMCKKLSSTQSPLLQSFLTKLKLKRERIEGDGWGIYEGNRQTEVLNA